MTANAIFDRIRTAITRDGSIADFARRSGISDSTLRSYTKGKGTLPSLEIAAQIARAANVSLDWIVNGDTIGFHEGDEGVGYVINMEEQANYVAITRIDGVLPPIADGSPEQEELLQIAAFRREWLSRMGVLPKFARFFVVKGDAMAPTLVAGDGLLIDSGVDDVEEQGIYLIRADDRLMLKRIAPRIDGSLQILSDNPIYPPEVIPSSEATSLKIIGQVRWFGRSI